jgi:hypothetical protein
MAIGQLSDIRGLSPKARIGLDIKDAALYIASR